MYYLISRDFYFVNYGSLSSQKKEKSVYALDLVLHRLQVHELAESHDPSLSYHKVSKNKDGDGQNAQL